MSMTGADERRRAGTAQSNRKRAARNGRARAVAAAPFLILFCLVLSACAVEPDYGAPSYYGPGYDAFNEYYGAWGGFDGWGGYGRWSGHGGWHHGWDHSGWGHAAPGHGFAGHGSFGGRGFGGHGFSHGGGRRH